MKAQRPSELIDSAIGTNQRAFFAALLAQKLIENKTSIMQQWQAPTGTTTRHFVIDNLLPEDVWKSLYRAFPDNADGFFSLDSFRERKRTSVNLDEYDPVLSDITYAFQNENIVHLVSDLVGLDQLEPDPTLYAAGLSMMFKNDFLNPHIDNSHDGKRNRYRRLNLLYYVSPDWTLDKGGNFELWNEDRTIPKTFVSGNNRLLVMETTKTSWHSVNRVRVCSARCCISNYYFSEISSNEKHIFT
jgi:Rps23 Pro-64 3,4-dihydroxylase Tpa1-like proline 4-hydroxylase